MVMGMAPQTDKRTGVACSQPGERTTLLAFSIDELFQQDRMIFSCPKLIMIWLNMLLRNGSCRGGRMFPLDAQQRCVSYRPRSQRTGYDATPSSGSRYQPSSTPRSEAPIQNSERHHSRDMKAPLGSNDIFASNLSELHTQNFSSQVACILF